MVVLENVKMVDLQLDEVWQVLKIYYKVSLQIHNNKEQGINCSCPLCFTPLQKVKAINYNPSNKYNPLIEELDFHQVHRAITHLDNKAIKPVPNYPFIIGWYSYCLKASAQIAIEDPTHPDNEEMPNVEPIHIVEAVRYFSYLLNQERK